MTTCLTCPTCSSSTRQIKAGFNRCGSQKYQCRHCKRLYTPQPKQPGYAKETRLQAVRMYLDGNNFRRIARLLSVAPQSVINWVNAYHATLPQKEDRSQQRSQVLEMDELFTFIGHKKSVSTSSPVLSAKRAASLATTW